MLPFYNAKVTVTEVVVVTLILLMVAGFAVLAVVGWVALGNWPRFDRGASSGHDESARPPGEG